MIQAIAKFGHIWPGSFGALYKGSPITKMALQKAQFGVLIFKFLREGSRFRV